MNIYQGNTLSEFEYIWRDITLKGIDDYIVESINPGMILECEACKVKNRVPQNKNISKALCGKCGAHLNLLR